MILVVHELFEIWVISLCIFFYYFLPEVVTKLFHWYILSRKLFKLSLCLCNVKIRIIEYLKKFYGLSIYFLFIYNGDLIFYNFIEVAPVWDCQKGELVIRDYITFFDVVCVLSRWEDRCVKKKIIYYGRFLICVTLSSRIIWYKSVNIQFK